MISQNTLIFAHSLASPELDSPVLLQMIRAKIAQFGYCLLRDFEPDLAGFSQLTSHLCTRVTYDPARMCSADSVQKVDAGTGEIGLHIENGNTPNIPELVAFFCAAAARRGSRTTVCDGVALLDSMSTGLQDYFAKKLVVTRTLPEPLWKRYLVGEHPNLHSIEQVEEAHLHQMLALSDNHNGRLNKDGSLTYSVKINPVQVSKPGKKRAFANALMGPSHNYQAPEYRFEDGRPLDRSVLPELARLAEQLTLEIPWQSGDIAVIDNCRVMHGRREILDASHRRLYIGMGSLA